jgi:hypothetical protein
VPTVDAPSLAAAIERLLRFPAQREALAAAARRRPLRTWLEYADELVGWLRELRRGD